MLSIIIIVMGPGIVVLHCEHTGGYELAYMRIAEAGGTMMSADEGCCPLEEAEKTHCPGSMAGNCLTIFVHELSPVVSASDSGIDLQPMPMALPVADDMQPMICPPTRTGWKKAPSLWHAPPREQLRMLRVWII